MDVETVRQEWETVHSGSQEASYVTKQHEPLNAVPLHLWSEIVFKRNHPFRWKMRQCLKKIAHYCGQAFHAIWYGSVYLYYFFIYSLLFLGPGYVASRSSSQQAGPDDPA